MIGNSFKEYAFIQACILFLHYIAPLSILCCVLTLMIRHSAYRIPLFLELIAIAETSFYLFVYLPRRYVMQHKAIHPTTLPRVQRRELFERCHNTVPNAEQYLQKWFKHAPLSEIKRDNVKEFFCWAFLNKGSWGPEDDEELDEYADKIEELLGKELDAGRGSAEALRLTLDEVRMLHRSLIWYICVSVVDTITIGSMWFHGFRFHRLRLLRTLTVFPFRPLTLASRQTTPAKTLTYWYKPHTSKTRLPILFVHGIGIGLYPYVNFLAELNRKTDDDVSDGDVGIIAVEIMPISFRITAQIPEKDQMCREIKEILDNHKWDKCVLVSHSYGSVISTHLLQHTATSQRIGPVLLVDPVSFLLHLPDVAYNFTVRKPRRANEHQLYYFGSMDMGVSHTLARRFFWSENILWKEDVKERALTVSLAGQDLIVDTPTVARYLTDTRDAGSGMEWQERLWKGQGLDVLWFPHLDHAQVFDRKRDYDRLVEVLRLYCSMTN